MEIEIQLLNHIFKKRAYERTFVNLIQGFEYKFRQFDPVANGFEVKKYFEKGEVTAKALLKKDEKISKEWLRPWTTKKGKEKSDFPGLYVFICENTPFYVGISQHVISRIFQHLKGASHHTSSLAYSIDLIRHELATGAAHTGTRNEFCSLYGVEPGKQFLFKQRLAWIPIESAEERYLFEVFCAMELECNFNKFETH